MLIRTLLPLAGVSTLALFTPVHAQDAVGTSIVLDTVTLIAGGAENIEATGGAVVTREDIEALDPADNSELFARESAVSVSGGAGPSKRIHVFGIEQSKLAVTVDGVPQGPTNWHHTGSNVIDPAFLKTVEVEAGAAAADAGFAAGAGALRYETVGARDLLLDGRTIGGRVSVSHGTNGRGWGGSLAGFGARDGLDWFVMVHGQDGESYKSGNGKTMPGTEPAAHGGLMKLGYEADGHRVELAYEHARDEADRVIKMNMDLNGDTTVFPLKVTRDTLSLTYRTTAPTDTWDPELLLYRSAAGYWRPNYATGDLGGGGDRINGDMMLDRDSFGGVVKNTFTLPQGTVTAGIDFAHDDYHVDNYGDHSSAQPRVRNFSTLQVGAFAQARVEFDGGFDLSTGLRYDHHRLADWNGARFTDQGASANATLSYRITDAVELFAGASRSWLGFDVGEYGLLHARDAAFATDPGYDPATATTYKLGLNASHDEWRAGLTFFDIRLDGLAEYDVEAGLLTNGGEGRSRGFTVNGAYEWDTGRIGATYTRADVTRDGEMALPSGGTFMPIGNMATLYVDQALPAHNLKLGASLEWAGKLSDEAMRAAGFDDHDSYTVVNTHAAWAPPQMNGATIRLGIDNLFDENYYERSSYVARQAGTRDVQPALAPGRTVTLGLTMEF